MEFLSVGPSVAIDSLSVVGNGVAEDADAGDKFSKQYVLLGVGGSGAVPSSDDHVSEWGAAAAEIDLIGVATDPLLHEDTVGDRIDAKLPIVELTQHSWIRRLH